MFAPANRISSGIYLVLIGLSAPPAAVHGQQDRRQQA
jgi:hypothetical protein